jgi:hypothetical protein
MKEIKDYLHLYLGCKIVFNDDMVWILSGVHRFYAILDGGAFGVIKVTDYSTIKPILRPLSNMTEDEIMEWRLINAGSQMPTIQQSAEEVKHLLSKHFDLFGLIEAGLAIDATSTAKDTNRD